MPLPPSADSDLTSRDQEDGDVGAVGVNPGPSGSAAAEPDTATLIDQLNQDRLWLLRQIDSGCWAEWRLDLAALERELGQLLDQARERGVS